MSVEMNKIRVRHVLLFGRLSNRNVTLLTNAIISDLALDENYFFKLVTKLSTHSHSIVAGGFELMS